MVLNYKNLTIYTKQHVKFSILGKHKKATFLRWLQLWGM